MKKANYLNTLQAIAYTFIIIGALNWALVGIFEFDLVAFLFGDMTALTKGVYILVGACALMSVAITLITVNEVD